MLLDRCPQVHPASTMWMTLNIHKPVSDIACPVSSFSCYLLFVHIYLRMHWIATQDMKVADSRTSFKDWVEPTISRTSLPPTAQRNDYQQDTVRIGVLKPMVLDVVPRNSGSQNLTKGWSTLAAKFRWQQCPQTKRL